MGFPRRESLAQREHREILALAGQRILVACRSGELGTAAARVRFAFEFAETLPRVAPSFPNLVSYKKKFIEYGDLKIIRL